MGGVTCEDIAGRSGLVTGRPGRTGLEADPAPRLMQGCAGRADLVTARAGAGLVERDGVGGLRIVIAEVRQAGALETVQVRVLQVLPAGVLQVCGLQVRGL
jgi:hypothetical protein